MTAKVAKSQVIAFRLGAHNLTTRLGEDELLGAAGRCGVQNSPPGSALLALHARVENVTPDRLSAAVAEEKRLLQTWSMRGAPFFFPTADAPVFTTGVLPLTEKAMRHFIIGVDQALNALDMSLTETVDLTDAEIGDVLTGRRLDINELGAAIAERIAGRLPKRQRDLWEGPGPYARGQPLGEGVVHFCIRILTLRRVVCLATREGNKALFALTEEWLGEPIPDMDLEDARAELLRRYLHCYGPSKHADFAAWLGVRAGDVGPWWTQVEDELTAVGFGGESWLLTEDLDALRSAPKAEGVRLLPPRDPYTQMRDRATIVDERFHRDLWKTVGEPGAILVDGAIVGLWRPRKNGRRLTVTVEAFGAVAKRHKRSLEDEAEQVGRLRGASFVEVAFGAP